MNSSRKGAVFVASPRSAPSSTLNLKIRQQSPVMGGTTPRGNFLETSDYAVTPKKKIVVLDNSGNLEYIDNTDELKDPTTNFGAGASPFLYSNQERNSVAKKSSASISRKRYLKGSSKMSRKPKKYLNKRSSVDLIKDTIINKFQTIQNRSRAMFTQTDPDMYKVCCCKKDFTRQGQIFAPTPSKIIQQKQSQANIGDSKYYDRKDKIQEEFNQFEKLYFKEQRNIFHDKLFNFKICFLALLTGCIFLALMWGIFSTIWNMKTSFVKKLTNLYRWMRPFPTKRHGELSSAEIILKFINNLFGQYD